MSSWSVLVVCEGNLARSPLAAALLQHDWPAHHLGSAHIGSAGTQAAAGEPATQQMCAVAASLGVDLGAHRSRRLSRDLLLASDLVLTLTEQQRELAQRLLPSATPRIFTLVEFVRLLRDERHRADGFDAVVSSAHATRPYSIGPDTAEDIDDPYGRGDDVYRRVGSNLAGLVTEITALLSAETSATVPPSG